MDSIASQNSFFSIRLRVAGIVIAAIFLVFIGRLWILQLTRWTTYADRALGNRTTIVWQQAPRGLIFDRNGQLLAENRSVWNINIVPAQLPDDPEQLEDIISQLASILSPEKEVASTARIRARIEEICSQTVVEPKPLQGVGEDVSTKVVQQVEARQHEMPGVVVKRTLKRHYPQHSLAAHLIGYVRSITALQYENAKEFCYLRTEQMTENLLNIPELAEQPIYTPNSLFGQEGVEAAYELLEPDGQTVPVLPGRRGYQLYEVNAAMQPVREIASRPPVPGATLYLTIDAKLQRVAEQALEQAIGSQHTGAVVMMDVETGEILVLASEPNLDANMWTKPIPPENWQRINDDEHKPLQNKAIAGEYPPGSVFKPISATAALQATLLSLNETFHCDGAITVGRHHQRFECWKRSGHGPVDFYKGMAESCDVYFYHTVLDAGLSSGNIGRYAQLFGLGNTTGIDIPGEEEGFVPGAEWKQTIKREPWLTGDTLNMVIGQGWLTVTPLQMTVATAAVANGGKVLTPRVVRKIQWPQWLGGQMEMVDRPPARQLELGEKTLARVRQGMRLAVTREHGTARILKDLGVTAAGKTGSAQHLRDRPTHAWFVCFAPYQAPKYAVGVFVWEGGGGGSTAAPIARRILAAAFGQD